MREKIKCPECACAPRGSFNCIRYSDNDCATPMIEHRKDRETNLSTVHSTSQDIKDIIKSAIKQGIPSPIYQTGAEPLMELFLFIFDAGWHSGYEARKDGG